MPRQKKDLKREVVTRQNSIDNYSFIDYFPDPDSVLEKLGMNADEAFKDLMADDQLTTVMGTRIAAIKGMNWDITQEDSTPQVSEAVENMLRDINRNHQGQGMNRFFDDILSANPWGMSAIETIWKTEGSGWAPAELKGRPFRYFSFDEENKLRFLTKNNMIYGEEIQPYKIILSRHWITSQSYDNPYGDKLLSKSYWPIMFKRNSIQFWQVFLEKYGMPWTIGKVPSRMKREDRIALADDLANMVRDGVLIVTDDNSVEFLEPGGKSGSSDIYLNCLAYMDKALAKIWLGQTLTTDVGDVGSYAASKTHQGVKDERRNQDKVMVESAAQTLIDWFVELNFGENVPSPEFRLVEPLGVNAELADRDVKLKNTGVKFTKVYFNRRYGLEDDEFEIEETKDEIPEFSKFAAKVPDDQKAIDDLLNSITPEELQEQAEGILKPVISLINKSGSYDDVMKNLLSAWPEMSTAKAEEMLTRAYFVSEMVGRLNG